MTSTVLSAKHSNRVQIEGNTQIDDSKRCSSHSNTKQTSVNYLQSNNRSSILGARLPQEQQTKSAKQIQNTPAKHLTHGQRYKPAATRPPLQGGRPFSAKQEHTEYLQAITAICQCQMSNHVFPKKQSKKHDLTPDTGRTIIPFNPYNLPRYHHQA